MKLPLTDRYFMNTNATLYFEDLKWYKDIKMLIGTQENLFIDFKETRGINGRISDNDKKNFSKAASGFAHQEGGVIVWGIEARKDQDGVDQVINLKPIQDIKIFKQELDDYVKNATEPIVDGIVSRIIFANDNAESNKGFLVSYFPKSYREHRAIYKESSGFYKRHGAGFSLLTTAEIKALFFRNLSPELKLEIKKKDGDSALRLDFFVKNNGRGIGKFVALDLKFSFAEGAKLPKIDWYDGEGHYDFKLGTLINSLQSANEKYFVTNSNIVVYPGHELSLCRVFLTLDNNAIVPNHILYKIFSEHMIPEEGSITFERNSEFVTDKVRWDVKTNPFN